MLSTSSQTHIEPWILDLLPFEVPATAAAAASSNDATISGFLATNSVPSEIDVARSDVIIPDQGMCRLTELSELGVVIYIPLRVVFEKRRCISLRLSSEFIKTLCRQILRGHDKT
jgi:hypothetical protein